MTQPYIFVAGLGRCGTTMVMNMLAAGGVPCAGPPPAYETSRFGVVIDEYWLSRHRGHAIKWVDPTLNTGEAIDPPAVAIFMSRNPTEQARSQLKMLGIAMPPDPFRQFETSIRIDEYKARRVVTGICGNNVLFLTFETALADPAGTARAIRAFLLSRGLPGPDIDKAASVVIPRGPECAPDLSIEDELIQRHEARHEA
jgi:hypothetical protein